MDKLVTNDKERFWNPEAYIRDQWVAEQARQLAPGSWVLDAGAGASKYRPYFAHCRYETQDFCKYEGPLVQYVQAINYVCDIKAIPLPDACLDAILCTEVFEHLTDPMTALKEFARLLKPGGKLLVTAPLLSHLHMEPYHYYGGFTHYWYRHWLPEHGFKVESISPVGGPGRTCSFYCQAFYTAWGTAEKRWSLLPRLASKTVRALAKIPIHFVLPHLLPKLDPYLNREQICSGYMVAATRLGGPF